MSTRYDNVEDYLSALPARQRAVLERVRATIAAAVPSADEKMSYGMPSFWQGTTLMWYSATRRHLGIYPTASGVAAFADRLRAYDTSKGTIRIPWEVPTPYGLIGEIAAFRAGQVAARQARQD